jgi:alpha-L-rhamnosidase
MANNERIFGGPVDQDWQNLAYDDSAWKQSTFQSMEVKMLLILNPWKLSPRPIPMLPEIPKRFPAATVCNGSIGLQTWKTFLSDDKAVTVPAKNTTMVDTDASILTTGFLSLRFRNGAGANIRILCSEEHEKDLGVDKAPFPMPRGKSDRSDYKSGRLYGTEDFYIVGNSSREHVFEPFWFRTFRYIQLGIICDAEDLTLLGFDFRETHYPLDISTRIESSSPEMELMWGISLRTLKNCMHETYEDCPFYE